MQDLTFEVQKATQAIREHAPAHLQDQLVSLSRPVIALQPTRAQDADIPLAGSKFGGVPDVPTDFVWPSWFESPLGFLAQINLEEIAPLDLHQVLPSKGLLSFFFDGFEGYNKEGNRVYWFEDITALNRFDAQSQFEAKSLTQTCRITPVFYLELPTSLESFQLVDGELVESEWYEISNLPWNSPFYPARPTDSENKMLGYGDDYGRGSILPDSRGYVDLDSLPPSTVDYHLLLQVVSEDRLGVMWGDVGTLDFMIHKDYLKARRFDEAQLTGTNG